MMAPGRILGVASVLAVMGFAILFTATDAARAADKDSASKLAGKWVAVKAKGLAGDMIPPTYEFTKKGAVTYSAGSDKWKGTYKVKGNKLTLKFSPARARTVTRTLTIQKLESDVLVIEEGANVLEFKKK